VAFGNKLELGGGVGVGWGRNRRNEGLVRGVLVQTIGKVRGEGL